MSFPSFAEKKGMRIWLFLVISLLARPTDAKTAVFVEAPLCPTVGNFLRNAFPRPKIEFADRSESILSLQDYSKAIGRAQTILPASFDLPPVVNLKVNQKLFGSRATAHSLEIQIAPSEFKVPASRTTTTIHEYGHLVFSWNMNRYSDEWKNWNHFMFQTRKYSDEQLMKLVSLKNEISADKKIALDALRKKGLSVNQPSIEKLNREVEILNHQIEIKIEERNQLRALRQYPRHAPVGWITRQNYEEAFADLLSVVVENNPKAISNLLSDVGGEPLGRDFTSLISPKNFHSDDPHHTLDPVRSFLWQNYLSKAETIEQKQKILEGVYDVFAQDLLKKESSKKLLDESIESFNERLIAKLKKRLSEK